VLDHVTIRVSDRKAAEAFYETVLATIGLARTASGEHYTEWRAFSLAKATNEKPVTRRLHVAFSALSRAGVDRFWRTGTEAGFAEDGPPGPRPEYGDDYYGGFLLDPDGNSVEAVHHGRVRAEGGGIDHLWIRVRNIEASKEFYELIAPYSGFEFKKTRPDRVHFAGDDASFALVRGEATENLHLAFSADANETVDAFHRAATSAAYRDNGPPGERTVYHIGYYGAFVLDPDGNNIEVVNHNR
jgi:catechol 2,3-dioxygenase-like lactoylglutathione lyase family enzyme